MGDPELVTNLLAALPQTQCTRCGYPDCAAYATAIASDEAAINQCPPGGDQGIERLAALTQKPVLPLDPAHGAQTSRSVAFVDEAWCIGCTLCIEACPTDAVVGRNKMMHTIIEPYCTGCELCIPVCPVDCIFLENVSGDATGWSAWSQAQADVARNRYELRSIRRTPDGGLSAERLKKQAQVKPADLASHSRIADPLVLSQKRAIIETALARSRSKREPVQPPNQG